MGRYLVGVRGLFGACSLGCGVLLGGVRPAWARFEPVTCRNSYSEDQEIAEGNKVAAKVYGEMPVLPDSDPLARYVQALGGKLVAHAPRVQGVDRQWPFNFHVVASEEINAFALPGGSVFVNLGTIQAAETEAQLAGVMAHEISHVVMRHSTCNLGRQRNKSILYGLGAIGSAVLLGGGAAGQMAQAGIGMGQNLDYLHMSRGDEEQADLLGVNILEESGYDPRGLPQFFETIRAKYGAGGAQFLSDHPNPGNRTEYVNAEIATLPRLDRPVVTTPAFTAMHATAMTRRALTAKEVQSGAWRASGQYAARPGGEGVAMVSAAGAGPGATPTQAPPPQSTAALSRDQLGLKDRMMPLQAARFGVKYPGSWTQSTDANGTVTLAPAGGAGSFGVAYGAVIGIAKQDGDGVTDAAGLASATAALLQQFGTQGSGLSEIGAATTMQVAGRPAEARMLKGVSPVSEGGGTPLPERDWLLTVARPDGDVSYMVFVAPERDFAAMKPVFDAMVASFQP